MCIRDSAHVVPNAGSFLKARPDIAHAVSRLLAQRLHSVTTYLADIKAQESVLAMTRRATQEDHVTGTPSFILDGALTDAHDWASLRPLLPTAAK